MNKTKLLPAILIGLIISSCSSDDNNSGTEPDVNEKKLLKVIQEGNYGIYERQFIYDDNDQVIEIESSFTEVGQTTTEQLTTEFNYENNLITSAIAYQNGILVGTYEFNYLNNLLNEKIVYNSNGTEIDRLEFNYNAEDKISSLNYFVDGDFQQNLVFTYNAANNIVVEQDTDYSEIQYDTNLTPGSNFTDSNKIIFDVENLGKNLSENNETNRTTKYNYMLPSETVRYFETTITYDADNYPISKMVVQTDSNGTIINTRTTTFEYE